VKLSSSSLRTGRTRWSTAEVLDTEPEREVASGREDDGVATAAVLGQGEKRGC
jgi:hypothetical protein